MADSIRPDDIHQLLGRCSRCTEADQRFCSVVHGVPYAALRGLDQRSYSWPRRPPPSRLRGDDKSPPGCRRSSAGTVRCGGAVGNLRVVAGQFGFPQSPMWSAMRWLSGDLAGWAMRRLLRAIADELGLGLSDAEIDILSEVALAAL